MSIAKQIEQFGALITDTAILAAVDNLAKRLTAKEKVIDELVSAIAGNEAAKAILNSIDTVKSYVETLLSICGVTAKACSKTVADKNRYQYFKRTVIQGVCEKLNLADEKTDVFSLADYLGKVVKTLRSKEVDAGIVDAIAALIPVEDETEVPEVPEVQ